MGAGAGAGKGCQTGSRLATPLRDSFGGMVHSCVSSACWAPCGACPRRGLHVGCCQPGMPCKP